ncbi:MAG TPA: glycosyltransferase family 39 protein [Candidatus Limnocylindria bacterium]|nr:glycosyltransferase family 39 protein [Candidatus Limnocylindria bacterium]
MRLQEWIHRLEEGGGAKYIRAIFVVVAFAMLGLVYDTFCFRNFTNPEAMDTAQLGRNIAEGRGFTTLFVRPLSITLTPAPPTNQWPRLEEGHRDISNPPLYPLLLAGVLSVTPDPGDLVSKRGFSVYLPNMSIAIGNQLLFGLGALLVFHLARRWFNQQVAWMAALLFVLTELYWRFTISGLSTMLLIDLVLLLVWLLSHFEERSRTGGTGQKLFAHAAALGAVTGLAMLTRYSVGWLILPVLIFTIVWATQRRWTLGVVTFAAFAVIVTPWIVRNLVLSGLPFGTATYAVLEGAAAFMGDNLQRSLKPSFEGLPGHYWLIFVSVCYKGMGGVREIIASDFPRLGGNWLWAFFLVGLLVRFQNANLSRLRWFVVASLLLLIPIQALTRTYLSAESPEVNSENLLVVFSPLVLIFGVGLFFVLFESLPLPAATIRYGALAGFVALVSLPFGLALLPPRVSPASPPYYPPRIQQVARYLNEHELWMSDIPWAMAWYGQRQCVWLTAKRADLFEIDDYQKSVNGLFISTRTTDSKFVSNWLLGENQEWGGFLLHTLVRREIPTRFPLKYAPVGLFTNGELLLTDRERWVEPFDGSEKQKKD